MESGEWKQSLPDKILFNTAIRMEIISNAWLHGTRGWVKYKADDGVIMIFHRDNPCAGYNAYWQDTSDDACSCSYAYAYALAVREIMQ